MVTKRKYHMEYYNGKITNVCGVSITWDWELTGWCNRVEVMPGTKSCLLGLSMVAKGKIVTELN